MAIQVSHLKKGQNAQIGIYLAAILMMGAIGVSSSVGVFMDHYQIDQVMALNVISIPCFAIIVVTLISGWLMSVMAKKAISIIGIVLFIIGGVGPAFLNDWIVVLVFRAIFGAGLGMVQVTTAALVAENYEGADKDRIMGWMLSFQMLGCIVFSIIGGQLGAVADVGFQMVFYVHLIGIISLIGVIAFVPYRKPIKITGAEDSQKEPIKVTGIVLLWAIVAVIFFMAGQVYSNVINILLGELNLGHAGEAGLSLAIFATGGFIMGFLFSKLFSITRGLTLSVGLFLLGISYALMAFTGNIIGIYAGSLICGLAFSVVVPCIMTSTSSAAVNGASAAFAISMATCGQALGQSISSYITTPLGEAMAQAWGFTTNQMTLTVAIIIVVAFGIIFVPWGIRQNARSGNAAEKRL